jgi:hypothetical protein
MGGSISRKKAVAAPAEASSSSHPQPEAPAPPAVAAPVVVSPVPAVVKVQEAPAGESSRGDAE